MEGTRPVASEEDAENDILIKALPPATDFISYLTLLEYNLTPQNLPILTQLLLSDDGALANEIGWDLVKLVLPMLADTPEAARSCLDVVGRRGNPREVIIRVAEELEKLGDEGEDDSDRNSAVFEQDEPPRFAGESKPIYLGSMTLDGNQATDPKKGPERLATLATSETGRILHQKFAVLLDMLGVLHPRIKTQYPSRFLATSLPAALGAYRRIPVSSESTSQFISLLQKLSGRQRPALPPRVSSQSTTSASPVSVPQGPGHSVPLPDPEAQSEASREGAVPDTDKEIIQRLLQAVALEILEEYISSMRGSEADCLFWTARLREQFAPSLLIPGRQTLTESWSNSPALVMRDAVVDKIASFVNSLKLDADKHFHDAILKLHDTGDSQIHDDKEDTAEENNQTPDFPTSPSDVPFPVLGLVFLFTAREFQSEQAHSVPLGDYTIEGLADLLLFTQTAAGGDHSSAGTDAMLALILILLHHSKVDLSFQTFKAFFDQLIAIMVQCPDAQLRDDAHFVAMKVFHAIDRERKANIVKHLFHSSSEDMAMFPALKAVVVNWIKDEFSVYQHRRPQASGGDVSQTNDTPETAIEPARLGVDKDFESALFPSAEAFRQFTEEATEGEIIDSTQAFLVQVPYYVASMNLLYLLLSRDVGFENDFERPTHLFRTLKEWCDILTDESQSAAFAKHQYIQRLVPENLPDLAALQDVLGRLDSLIRRHNG